MRAGDARDGLSIQQYGAGELRDQLQRLGGGMWGARGLAGAGACPAVCAASLRRRAVVRALPVGAWTVRARLYRTSLFFPNILVSPAV